MNLVKGVKNMFLIDTRLICNLSKTEKFHYQVSFMSWTCEYLQ